MAERVRMAETDAKGLKTMVFKLLSCLVPE